MVMSPLSLYVTTTRMVLQANVDDGSSWSDVNRLLGYLRQSLICCVCGQILHAPMSSTISSCQHHVCKTCVGGKMRLKPSCSWCKDHSKFIENIQLRILIQCYKQLTTYILSSPIALQWSSLTCEISTGSSYSSNAGCMSTPTTFGQILEEGANIPDKFNFADPLPLKGLGRSVNNHHNSTSNPLSPVITTHPQPKKITTNRGSVIEEGPVNETINVVTASTSMLTNITNDVFNTNQEQVNPLVSSTPTVQTPTSKKVRRGCRCGLATPNPGKLTCCGQRCPCYVENKPCNQCKCRGCRNPNKPPGAVSSDSKPITFISTNVTHPPTSIATNTASSTILTIPTGDLLQIPIITGDDENETKNDIITLESGHAVALFTQ